jgi:hypothetical protein
LKKILRKIAGVPLAPEEEEKEEEAWWESAGFQNKHTKRVETRSPVLPAIRTAAVSLEYKRTEN